MNDSIKVSIICAAYNHEKFIADALESFVSQKTDFQYEVIVNDDASTDNTASIIREYQEKYPEIVKPIFQKENQYSRGISVIDIMVNASSGKYIATCEGDDYWIDERKLQKQVDFMESHPECSMFGHANNIVKQDGEYLRTRCDCKKGFVNLINDGGYMHFATRVAKREVYTTFPAVLTKKYYEGVAYIYYAHALGKVYFDDTPMSVWRLNENSVTHSIYLGQEKVKEIVKDYIGFYKRFDSYTKGHFNSGLQKRSSEQIVDLIQKCVKTLTKNDYRELKKEFGFDALKPKYKLYILVRGII